MCFRPFIGVITSCTALGPNFHIAKTANRAHIQHFYASIFIAPSSPIDSGHRNYRRHRHHDPDRPCLTILPRSSQNERELLAVSSASILSGNITHWVAKRTLFCKLKYLSSSESISSRRTAIFAEVSTLIVTARKGNSIRSWIQVFWWSQRLATGQWSPKLATARRRLVVVAAAALGLGCMMDDSSPRWNRTPQWQCAWPCSEMAWPRRDPLCRITSLKPPTVL